MPYRDDLGNICDYRVNLRLYSIAMPHVSELTSLQNAQRVYGQYGICISFITGESIFLSKQQQADLDQIDGSCSFDGLQSEDQRQLHSLRDDYGDSPFDIRVYFVNKIYDPELKYLNGCGGYDPGRPALHTAFSATEWTFAHELGHVLLGANFRPVHLIGDTKNIMTEKTTNLKCDLPILTPLQLAAIKSSKYCRRCDEFGKPFYWKTTRKQIR